MGEIFTEEEAAEIFSEEEALAVLDSLNVIKTFVPHLSPDAKGDHRISVMEHSSRPRHLGSNIFLHFCMYSFFHCSDIF